MTVPAQRVRKSGQRENTNGNGKLGGVVSGLATDYSRGGRTFSSLIKQSTCTMVKNLLVIFELSTTDLVGRSSIFKALVECSNHPQMVKLGIYLWVSHWDFNGAMSCVNSTHIYSRLFTCLHVAGFGTFMFPFQCHPTTSWPPYIPWLILLSQTCSPWGLTEL